MLPAEPLGCRIDRSFLTVVTVKEVASFQSFRFRVGRARGHSGATFANTSAFVYGMLKKGCRILKLIKTIAEVLLLSQQLIFRRLMLFILFFQILIPKKKIFKICQMRDACIGALSFLENVP